MRATVDTVIEWQRLSSGVPLSREEFGAVPINDAIASADRVVGWLRSQVGDSPDVATLDTIQKYENLSKLYGWFRDKCGIDSIAEVIDLIEQRKVPPEIASIWASELLKNGLPGIAISKAIKKGYPELKEQIADDCNDGIAEALKGIDETLGEES